MLHPLGISRLFVCLAIESPSICYGKRSDHTGSIYTNKRIEGVKERGDLRKSYPKAYNFISGKEQAQ